MYFIDANIILRYLMRDDDQKALACLELFRKATTNEIELTTTEAIIAEVVSVMVSKKQYGLPREQIRTVLYPVLAIPGLKIPKKEIYFRALDLFQMHTQRDFEDAITVAHMEFQGISTIYSYDTDFDNIPGITRLEPATEIAS